MRHLGVKISQIVNELSVENGGPAKVALNSSRLLSNHIEENFLIFGKNSLSDSPVFSDSRLWFLNFAKIRKLRQQLRISDLILHHGFFLISLLIVILVAKRNTPITIMPHGSLEKYELSRKALKKKIFAALFRILTSKRNIYFGVATESERDNLPMWIGQSKVRILGIGIPEEKFLETGKFLRDDINLVSYSRIAEKKRIDRSILALKHLKIYHPEYYARTKFFIAGSGSEALTTSLSSLAIANEVIEKVFFVGQVKDEEEIDFFKSASILLLPSENENFAVAVAESIVFLTPVIISRDVALNRFVDKHQTGLVLENSNPEYLAKAIIETVENYPLFTNNCLKARELLSWRKVIPVWLSNFRDIIDG